MWQAVTFTEPVATAVARASANALLSVERALWRAGRELQVAGAVSLPAVAALRVSMLLALRGGRFDAALEGAEARVRDVGAACS